MFYNFSRRTALLLLPVLVQALVLPSEIADTADPSRFNFDSPSYGGPSTFFEYDIDDHSIKFAIPCPDCSEEEKELLKHEIISVKPTAQETRHCTSTDPIGLEIDDRQVISTGESSLSLQSHIGPLHVIDHSKHHIFNRTRWINHCGCTKTHLEDEECDKDYESAFSFEVLGLPSGQIPGFTISYKQHGRPELLRFSTYPDIGIADSWRFGRSAHYKSPPLRLQKALFPTSTAIFPSSSLSPSSTASASSPSYSVFEKNPSVFSGEGTPKTSILPEAGLLAQSLDSRPKTVSDTIDDPVEHQDSRRRRLSGLLTAVGHGFEAVAMNAKSGAQRVLGKVSSPNPGLMKTLPIPPVPISATTISPVSVTGASPSYLATRTPDVVGHDEIDDGGYIYEALDIDPVVVNTMEEILHDAVLPLSGRSKAEKAFLLTSLVFIVVGLSGSLYALARRNPRLRARWATVLEEKRNQRLYRHAARKHRFLNFFSRRSICPHEKNDILSPSQTDDALDWHEWEKRLGSGSIIQDQQSDAHTLNQDLLAFRKAHQFVDSIISAEEGRPSASRRGHRDRYNPRVRHHRAWSFGSEKTAPPPYESDGEDLVLDADGPRFVDIRRRIGTDISPDSSVISTSPRSSCVDSDSEHDEKF